jgi:hypothetical protein
MLLKKRALCDEAKLRKAKTISDSERTTLIKVSWGQKSRVLWLRLGDQCTMFFPNQT